MRYLLILVVLLIGCQDVSESHKNTEDYTEYYEQICLDGVKYWKRGNRLAPVFNKDSKVEVCK